MNADQLFAAMGDIDERFILEAEEITIPHRTGKMLAAAAAVALVAAGSVWFSGAMLHRPDPLPQELAAPTAYTEPTAPPESAPPGTDVLTPAVPDDPAQPTPEQTPIPTPTPANVPDLGSGGSGSWLPQWGEFGLPGWGVGGSDPPGHGSGSSPLPGDGSLLPGMGGAAEAYHVEYQHSDAGDFLVLRSPVLNVPVATKNITGQIVDGFYAGSITAPPFGPSVYVELRVFEDGSFELSY